MNFTLRAQRNRLGLLVLVGAVILTALTLPRALGAWWLNQAHSHIARALGAHDPGSRAALQTAETQLEHARALSDDPHIALARARIALARNQAPRAAEELRATGASWQDDFNAQFIWGNAEWQAGNATAAFEHWRAAGAFTYFINQAHRAADQHAWQTAEQFARMAIGIAPDNGDAHYALGDALAWQRTGDAEALRALTRAAELTRDPEKLATILSRQGEVFAAQGDAANAQDFFERAIRVAPLDARPRTGIAKLWLRADAEARAVALLTQVIGDSPWYLDAYVTLAQIAERHGEVAAAEQWFAAGLAKNPNNPDLLFLLGEFYTRQNRAEQARQTLSLALKFEPHADDAQSIQRALQKLGER